MLVAGLFLPETQREYTLSSVENFQSSTVELDYQDVGWFDLRRWFFDERAGASIRVIQLPLRDGKFYQANVFAGLDDAQANDAFTKILSRPQALQNLQRLELTTRHLISDENVRQLGNLQSLRFLWLSNAEITTAGVESLSRLTELEVVFLDSCRFKTDDFSKLAKLPNLAWVRIQQVDPAEEHAISDAGIASFREAAKHAYVQKKFDGPYVRKKIMEQYQKKQKSRRK